MKKGKNDLQWLDLAVTARKYKTTPTRKFLERKVWVKPAEGDVFSLLPGTIIDVAVKPGDNVKAGDLLLMQESMKMHNRVTTPVSGTVAKVWVAKGDKVPKDFLMVRIG